MTPTSPGLTWPCHPKVTITISFGGSCINTYCHPVVKCHIATNRLETTSVTRNVQTEVGLVLLLNKRGNYLKWQIRNNCRYIDHVLYLPVALMMASPSRDIAIAMEDSRPLLEAEVYSCLLNGKSLPISLTNLSYTIPLLIFLKDISILLLFVLGKYCMVSASQYVYCSS